MLNDRSNNWGGSSRRLVSLLALSALFFSAEENRLLSADPGPEKLVFAHHMGSLNAGRGAMAWHTRNPELGDPATSNGGDYRTVPLVPYEMWDLTLEESAELQIRRAMRIGIDGFAVNAWAGGDQARDFLDALFYVAETNDYPFYISICPDPSAIEQPHGLTRAVADAITYLLDRHGDSPKLARRDGKPIIFGYQSNFVWVEYLENKYDGDRLKVDTARTTEEGWALVGEAYANLEAMVGQELYFQFDMGAFYHGLQVKGVPEDGYARAAAVIAQYMPAVCQFLPSPHTRDFASETVAAGAEWGQPIYMNYDNPRTNWTFGGPGTDELRRRWAEAREFDSTLLQLTTWNDYHENTNISPGTNNNYAYFDLTAYFIEWWKTGIQPEPDRDRMYLFSRKYPWGTPTFPFQSIGNSDGVIEILTILPEPARVRVPDRGEYDAPAGLSWQHFPVTPGPVSAELIRDGNLVAVVESPEPVTARPFRQDNGITGISTECEAHWRADFGDAPREFYSEYGDLDGDGLPNWFEMYWFGHFGNKSTATVANPHEDVNGDGYTNLEAYLQRRSPISEQARSPFADSPSPVPGRLQAEHFDRGGPGVAYFDTTPENQGGAFRPDEHVDLEPAADEGGGYNVGWIESGEWMKYTVDVAESGIYIIELRVASPTGGGALRLSLDGVTLADAVSIPATGGWQTWQTVSLPPVMLQEGPQTFQVSVKSGGFNLNYFEFSAGGRFPFLGTPIELPGRLRMKHFDFGGPDVAYHDTTPANQGNGFRPLEAVDLEPTSDVGGGYNLGWTEPGEWLAFTVNVETAGIYNLTARVASPVDDGRFQVEFEGAEPIRIDVPNTGGWQYWATVTVPDVSLREGTQTVRVVCLTGGFNANYLEVLPRTLSFNEWLQVHFSLEELSEPSLVGPTADASGNGIPNLMEYALHRNPRDPGRSGLPQPGKTEIDGKKYLTFTYTRPAGVQNLDYRVEISRNRIDWLSGDDHVVFVSIARKGDSDVVVMRDAKPIMSSATCLIRLRVTPLVEM